VLQRNGTALKPGWYSSKPNSSKIRTFVVMRLFRSILSLALAALVLLASSSFYVATHSCSGRVNKVAFLETADGCGHAKMPPCHQKMMKGCCEDEMIAHEGQDLKYESKLTIHPSFISFAIVHTPALMAEIIPSSARTQDSYRAYDTPLRSADRTVEQHSFLI
jgi:hypothetical protein